MGKALPWLLLFACILVAQRSFVSSAPNQLFSAKTGWRDAKNLLDLKEKTDDEPSNEGNVGIDSQQIPDEDVKALERLKPSKTLSVVKTHSTLFSNIHGEKEQHIKTKEEVEKDGELLARVSQEVDKTGNVAPHVKTALDIPSRNIHKVLEEPGGTNPLSLPPQPKRVLYSHRNAIHPPHPSSADNTYKQSGLHYSPLDMAEYVFWTGDEKGVTLAIEEFLQNGMMSREDAIGFLQDIKQNLDYLQAHYTEDHYRNPPKDERGNSELTEVRQRMRDNLGKKSEPEAMQDSLQNEAGLLEDDYEDLLERLRVADLLYNEYSLEEVIYQLAKLMFTQSLTRGSTEAQEALQKFTNFLEQEAQQGRISRNLEKKVLDVLIASLSDTLTEHPELVSTARESLGSGLAAPSDQLLQQFMTQDKPALERGAGVEVGPRSKAPQDRKLSA